MKLPYPKHVVSMSLVALTLFGTTEICYAKSKVTLVATLDNQPAFRSVLWNIFDIRNRKDPLKTLPRHSGTIELPAGQYVVTLEFNKQTKETIFRLEPEQNLILNVAMD